MSQDDERELYERTLTVIRRAVDAGAERDDVLAACYASGINSKDVYKERQNEVV